MHWNQQSDSYRPATPFPPSPPSPCPLRSALCLGFSKSEPVSQFDAETSLSECCLLNFRIPDKFLARCMRTVFGIFVFSAAFTPTADPFTMLLLALPIMVLYFMAGSIALLVDRARDKKSSTSIIGSSSIDSPTSISE